MVDSFDPAHLATNGQLLARVDDVDYLDVELVVARPLDGTPTIYCRRTDWSASSAARLAEKNREIAELESMLSRQAAESLKQAQRAIAAEARIKELEAQLADTPAQNQDALFRAQAAYVHDTPPDPIVCPDCDKGGWKSARALQMHQQRVHQGMVAVRSPAPQLVEDLGWRCDEPGCAGAFTRSLSSPDYCTLHAPVHTNGRH